MGDSQLGFQGNQGPQGKRGHQGHIGHQGDRGFIGFAGEDGDPAKRGFQGIIGPDNDVRGTQGPQGNNGDVGPQGKNGFRGFQGIEGNVGFQGSQGVQGEQGDPNFIVGPQGPEGGNGNPGLRGPQGVQGPNGIGTQGSQGFQGAQQGIGAQGPQGFQGPQGQQGFQGFQGPNAAIAGGQGPQGWQGFQGLNGNQGFKGFQGFQGPQGNQGNVGILGSQGNQGNQGNQGVQGNQGFQGFQGSQGSQGGQGFLGAQGTQGFQGFQSNQGNSGAQGAQGFFGVQGPQGFQGFSGWQGVQGMQGNQGVQGVQGSQGFQGAQGNVGVVGNQGFQGLQGATGLQGWQEFQGQQGTQGPQGAQGLQGFQGFQGFQGVQGAQGFQGLQGWQGFQGFQGFQDAQGFQGAQGFQSFQGFQGFQGSQGFQGFQGNQGFEGAFQGAQGSQGFQGFQGTASVPGFQGVQGAVGFQGFQGPDSFTVQTITPTDSVTNNIIDPSKDLVYVDTSNFSALCSLAAPSVNRKITLRLLNQDGLVARVDLVSGGTVLLTPSIPIVTLFYNTLYWTQTNNSSSLGALVGNVNNQVKLVPTGVIGGQSFFSGISFSADGNVLAVGGTGDNGNIGATWVWTRNPTTHVWTQQAKLVGTGYTNLGSVSQGFLVGLSADGATLAVSGPNDNNTFGAVWVFTQSGGVWTQQAMIVPTGATGTGIAFGTGMWLSADGNVLAVGANFENSNQGAAYFFTRASGVWTQKQRVTGSDTDASGQFGSQVNTNYDGKSVIISAVGDNGNLGAATVFSSFDLVTWTQVGSKFVGPGAIVGNLFACIAFSADGQTAAFTQFGTAGTVWIYSLANNIPQFITTITTDLASLNSGAGFSADGNSFISGTPSTNSNMGTLESFFRGSNNNWTFYAQYLPASPIGNGALGYNATMNSDGSVMGGIAPNDNSFLGAVYVWQ
jgi:hypothetical protein